MFISSTFASKKIKRLPGYLPFHYQACLLVLTISILSIIQLAIVDKACLAFNVTCTVKDNSTDLPIHEAVVVLISSGEVTIGVTNANGEVIFAGVEAGTYGINVDAQCYRLKKLTNSIVSDVTLKIELNPVSETEKGSLSGIVKDGLTESPINGAPVKILPDGPTTQTNEIGEYNFGCVEVKLYRVSASKDGYVSVIDPVEIETPPSATIHDFPLFPPKIFGTVTELVGEPPIPTPIPGVRVEALEDEIVSASKKTNDKGKYALYLNPGTYKIKASKAGYLLQTSDEIILGEETIRQDFSLAKCEGWLFGKVKNKDTGEPIENATVKITEPPGEASATTTDDKGKYEFDEQCLTPDTSYTVEAKKSGYKTGKIEIPSAAEGENELNFKLKAGRTTTTTTRGRTTTTRRGTTTTRRTTTTTTIPGTTCEPCVGEDRGITFNMTCNSFSFTISGESGTPRKNLKYVRDKQGRAIFACGTVTYASSGNTYCVEITVEWGRTCIKSIQGFAKKVVE